METANARDGETALTTWAARLRPSVAVFAILGVAVSVAASLYVLRNAAEAPEVNAIVRGIMALTALAVGLYLWQRQPHNRYGPVLAAAVFFLSPMALAVSEDPWTFTIGRTVGAVAIVYAVFLALLFPDGRAEERGARLVLAATVAASGVVWTAALVLAETLPAGGPFIPCFEGCPDNAARVVEISPDPSNVLGFAYGVVCAGLGLAAAAVLLRRLRAATPVRRRAIGPVLVVIAPLCIGMGAFIFIRQVAPDSRAARSARLAGPRGVCAVPRHDLCRVDPGSGAGRVGSGGAGRAPRPRAEPGRGRGSDAGGPAGPRTRAPVLVG